jgi:hypothetical protein
MSDETTANETTANEATAAADEALKRPRTRSNEVIEDAVVVEEPATPVAAQVPATPVTVTKVEPVVTTADVVPATAATAAADPQVVYMHAPAAPQKKSNRGLGVLLAVLFGIIFAAAFALVIIISFLIQGEKVTLSFLTASAFYVPVIFYIVGAILLALIINRGGWGAWVFGSIFVGVIVYFGTILVFILGKGIITMTPADGADLFGQALRNPLVIAAAFIAREVSMWSGALSSRRGRRLRAHNAEAHAAWQQDIVEKKAEYERGAAATPAAV